MNNQETIRYLRRIRAEIDALLEKLGAAPDPGQDAGAGAPAAVNQAFAAPAADAPVPAGSGASLLDALDLTDTVRDVYFEILKHGEGLSFEEMRAVPSLAAEEGLQAIVRTLLRQGHLERVENQGMVRYRALAGHRGGRKMDDDIWNALA